MELFLLAFATGFGAAVAVSLLLLPRRPAPKPMPTLQYRDGYLHGFYDANKAAAVGADLPGEFFLTRRLSAEGDPWEA